jgi:tetratricopeptide (TPR) repeat protein
MQIMKWFVGKFNDYSNRNNPDYWVKKAEENQAKSIKYYNKAISIYQKNSNADSDKIAEIHLKKGEIHSKNQKYSDAITSFNKALKIYKDNPDKSMHCHFNLGLACSNSYQYSEAIKSFTNALEISTDDGFSAKINFEIGRVYLRQKLDLKDEFEKNLKFCKSFSGTEIKLDTMINLEGEYNLTRATLNEQIIGSFQKILDNKNNSIDPQTLFKINYTTAEACLENDDKVLAKRYYESSLEILNSPQNSFHEIDKIRSNIEKILSTLNPILTTEGVRSQGGNTAPAPAPAPPPPSAPATPPPPPPPSASPQPNPIIVAITDFLNLCSCSQKR